MTRNRLWNRSMFYCILGVPGIRKKVSGRCRMWVLHSNNGVEWRSAFSSRNLEIDGPRHGKVTFGSHFGRPGDTQTCKKSIWSEAVFSVDFRSRKGGVGPRREYSEMAGGPFKEDKRRYETDCFPVKKKKIRFWLWNKEKGTKEGRNKWIA